MGRENYSSGEGKQKKIVFSFKIEISYPDPARLYFLHKKKEIKLAKISLQLMLRVLAYLFFE